MKSNDEAKSNNEAKSSNEAKSNYKTNFNEKKATRETQNFYILLAFFINYYSIIDSC